MGQPKKRLASAPESLHEVSDLVIELAAVMHAVSTPADRTEAALREITAARGIDLNVLVLQDSILCELKRDTEREVRVRRIPFDSDWRLATSREVLDLAAALGRDEMTTAQGHAELARLAAAPDRPKALVVAAYGVYSAAVAARVGGGVIEMLAGAAIGLIAGGIHVGAIRSRKVALQKTFVAAVLAGLATWGLTVVLPPFNIAAGLFGGLTLLVPAMVLTIATQELANGCLESGMARMAWGLLRFAMIAVGLTAVLTVWRLVSEVPLPTKSSGLPQAAVAIIVAIGGMALVFCLQARLRDAAWVVSGACLAYGVQDVAKLVVGDHGAPLLAAFVLGILGGLAGRRRGQIPATVIVPGLLMLAPGFLGTRAVLDLIAGQPGAAAFVDVFIVAMQLVLGLWAASTLTSSASRRA